MPAQLYLDNYRRAPLTKPYYLFKETYNNKISSLFANIEEEAKEVANKYYKESGINFNPDYHDQGDFAEAAWEKGIEYLEAMALMDYTTKLSMISTLYQFWEQQVRNFLYTEIKHSRSTPIDKDGNEIPYKKFCLNIGKINDCFLKFGQDLKQLNSWDTIDELRLLTNVIKHGDGDSAVSLAKRNPDFFVSEYSNINLLELYGTSLNERVINFSLIDFDKYADALVQFWIDLPVRMYSSRRNPTSV